VVLIWLRLDWGLTNTAPQVQKYSLISRGIMFADSFLVKSQNNLLQAYLPNFWSGIYLMFAGSCLGLLDSMLACCAAVGTSIRLLITTQAKYYYFQ
jgi:hypothetical protein